MTPTHSVTVPLAPALSKQAQQSHVLRHLSTGSLISIGNLCDDDCTAIFSKAYNNYEIIVVTAWSWMDTSTFVVSSCVLNRSVAKYYLGGSKSVHSFGSRFKIRNSDVDHSKVDLIKFLISAYQSKQDLFIVVTELRNIFHQSPQRTLSVSTINYRETYFPKPDLSPIICKPTFESLHQLIIDL